MFCSFLLPHLDRVLDQWSGVFLVNELGHCGIGVFNPVGFLNACGLRGAEPFRIYLDGVAKCAESACHVCGKVRPQGEFKRLQAKPAGCDYSQCFSGTCCDCEKLHARRIAESSGDLRRIRLAFADGSHTVGEWADVVARFGGACLRCGSLDGVTKDHIRPLSRGGGNDISNLQPLCKKCNSWKGTKEIDFRDHSCSQPTELFELARVSG